MPNKRCIPTKANLVNEDNILRDKTLIDLCGVTLFWRSAKGLSKTATMNDLKRMVDCLNLARFQCPILYKTLRMPSIRDTINRPSPASTSPGDSSERPASPRSPTASKRRPPTVTSDSKPYVYLNCGHVHGWHTWRALDDVGDSIRTCPMCRQSSPFVPLQMGLEPAFYIDRRFPTHCFNPCGHMASEKTCRYWCGLRIPNNHDFSLQARCPFCLAIISPTPVRLLFNSDEENGDMWWIELATQLSDELSADGSV
ncbi:E3 ubiquitin-protein ligase pellino 1 [Fasciola gigantica]|uniref:E3 ubiquitin-protein ligase pellino 1 n=1 Tax=Fasciola gigantica TaxID=46835 RepID=A0A504YMJ9_FASGI|nr:E3 ubiquitin-protein ligase pellino 1 [Fasciola gigantica]